MIQLLQTSNAGKATFWGSFQFSIICKAVLAGDFVSPVRDTHDREVCKYLVHKMKTSNLGRLCSLAVTVKHSRKRKPKQKPLQ